MKIIRQKKDLNNLLGKVNSFSFIPTMGGLHKGHEILIKKARKKGLKTLVSIFVNPKQFNSRRDFKTYPRNLKTDTKILNKLKVNYLYYPKYKDIFSFKTKNKIYMHSFSRKLCGKYRPGHFSGVLDVVNRFLELLNPKYIVLGKKDFQQLTLIKKHIKKNKINTEVISCETMRDFNKLPYSSRNLNLDKQKRLLASKIFTLIRKEKIYIKKNKIKIINFTKLKKKIFDLGIKKIDYIEAVNLNTLKKAYSYNEKFNIFSAFYINKVRLIDNF